MSDGQMSLLGWTPPRPAAAAPEQPRQLARVTGRIGETVLAFCRAHVGHQFHASELSTYVMAHCGGAPASADRVLRQLRREGYVQVELVDRAGSLYRVVGVAP